MAVDGTICWAVTGTANTCINYGAIGVDVEAWTEAALASGEWVVVDREPQTLQSTYQREPVDEVEIDRETWILTLFETNLET